MNAAAGDSGQGRSVSYLAWRLTAGLLKGVVGVGSLCLTADLVIWGLTWASPSLAMPDWIFAPGFAFAFLGTFATVLAVVGVQRRPSVGGLLAHRLPRWIVASVVVLAAVFFISGPAELLASGPGQPGYNSFTHRYYYDDHGRVIRTDRAHYLSAVAVQTRGFLSVAIAITCLMLLIAFAQLRRRRSVVGPRLRDIPVQEAARPRLCPAVGVGLTVAAVGLLLLSTACVRIVERVDHSFAHIPPVTTRGLTETLRPGPWVVFTFCETHVTDAPYGCPHISPADVVITEVKSGAAISARRDPSSDHVSPDNLPADGQLTFRIVKAGRYELRLTREVPKGVFVAQSPGTTARSVVPTIALAFGGFVVFGLGVVLLERRMSWRLGLAPRVAVADAYLD